MRWFPVGRETLFFTLLTAFVVWGGDAQAAGTVAGTTVTKQVTVNCQVSGVAQTPVTATATMLTGQCAEKDVRRALAFGVADYIVKPVAPRALLERVERALEAPAGNGN